MPAKTEALLETQTELREIAVDVVDRARKAGATLAEAVVRGLGIAP